MSKKRLLYGGGAVVAGVLLIALLLVLASYEEPGITAQGVSHMSGPLDLTGSASASAPGLYFEGDSDTGLYSVSANNLGVATGGTQRLKVYSGGVDVTGGVDMSGDLSVDGAISSGTGAVTVTDSVNITGAVDIDSTLNVDGAATLNSTLDVDGAISSGTGAVTVTDSVNITGAVDIDSTLNVDGATTLVGVLDAQGDVSDSGGDFTIADSAVITGTLGVSDTLTVNQAAARDIAVFQDSGTTTVKVPDGGGLLLNPAGSPSGSEGLLNYDNAKSGFEKLEVYDGEHWRPVDPRVDMRDQTFIIHSGTAEYESVFSWIPRFTHPDLGITMGGFWMAKYEMSQPTATRTNGDPIIADDGDPSTTPAVSVPGVALWDNIQFDEARKAVKNAGEEYHLCTAEEWAAAAYWSQLTGTMPYGNNNDSSTAPGDVDVDAYDCVEGGMTDKLCGTGTGPNAFSLNYWGSGPMDLNGNVWEWVDGLYMDTNGYVYVFTTTLHIDELQGVAESAAGSVITDTDQNWTVDELVGMYLQQGTNAIGDTWRITGNTATTITVNGASVSAAEYSIVEQVATDVTASAGSSGDRILTLWEDAELRRFAIPKTSDGTGSATYGNDGFWYSKSAFRAAKRGGYWTNGVGAGVFALSLSTAPSIDYTYLGFRACRTP